MTVTSHRTKTESLIYWSLWILAATVYIMAQMRMRALTMQQVFDTRLPLKLVVTFAPYVLLFVVNNFLLIPRLLLRNRTRAYLLATFVLLAITVIYLYLAFKYHFGDEMMASPHHPPAVKPPHHEPFIPLPIILDSSYAMLIVGINMAVALLFQRFDYKLERESLMSANMRSELANLKAQINPHFYMNMLNNIHGMIEINAEKAQAMVLDMSRLMRYMLYDSSRPLISLHDEVLFIRNYISLMRIRFPENRVAITVALPDHSEINGYKLPPLLFLVFIENAFKHGVSYRHDSFVSVSLEITPDAQLRFSCLNSRHDADEMRAETHGIGLKNVRQRMSLIYGSNATLNISETANSFTVNLQIPLEK